MQKHFFFFKNAFEEFVPLLAFAGGALLLLKSYLLVAEKAHHNVHGAVLFYLWQPVFFYRYNAFQVRGIVKKNCDVRISKVDGRDALEVLVTATVPDHQLQPLFAQFLLASCGCFAF